MAQDALALRVPAERKDRSRGVASIYVWRRRLLAAFVGLLMGLGASAVIGWRGPAVAPPAPGATAHPWGGLPACSQPLNADDLSPIAFQSSRGRSLGLLTDDQKIGVQFLGSQATGEGANDDFIVAIHSNPLREDGGDFTLISVRGECILGSTN